MVHTVTSLGERKDNTENLFPHSIMKDSWNEALENAFKSEHTYNGRPASKRFEPHTGVHSGLYYRFLVC